MKNSKAFRQFVPGALTLVFLLGLVTAFVSGMDAQKSLRPLNTVYSSSVAERDLRMVMQEQGRERLDQLNVNSIDEQSRARIAAALDRQMMMQELEREQFPQLYAKSFDAASIACNPLRTSCDR